MTLLYVVLSVFPIIEVGSRLAFTLKVGGVVILGNLVGLGILWVAERRKSTLWRADPLVRGPIP
jgi:hypothetical protein